MRNFLVLLALAGIPINSIVLRFASLEGYGFAPWMEYVIGFNVLSYIAVVYLVLLVGPKRRVR